MITLPPKTLGRITLIGAGGGTGDVVSAITALSNTQKTTVVAALTPQISEIEFSLIKWRQTPGNARWDQTMVVSSNNPGFNLAQVL